MKCIATLPDACTTRGAPGVLSLKWLSPKWLRPGADKRVQFSAKEVDMIQRYFEISDEDESKSLNFEEVFTLLGDLGRAPRAGDQMRLLQLLQERAVSEN